MTDPAVPLLAVVFPLEGNAYMTRIGSASELQALGAWLWRPAADRRVIAALSELAAALAEAEQQADDE